jgi:molybdate transport system substrate-binding protein
MKARRLGVIVISVLSLWLWGTPESRASEAVTVAVSVDFAAAFNEIAYHFRKSSGYEVQGIWGSTGVLFDRIVGGESFDLFFAADRARPDELYKRGLAEEPFVYAVGQVVLWTRRPSLCLNGPWNKLVALSEIKKVGIPDPDKSPYGAAAVKALQSMNLWSKVKAKAAVAPNVIQVFQQVNTQRIEVGFCSMSLISSEYERKGCYFALQEAPPLIQAACVLKRPEKNPGVARLIQFLKSPDMANIKLRFGYE